MALDYLTLSHKPKFKIKDKNNKTQYCLDLLAPTTSCEFYEKNGQKCVVNKYYVARPDLISLAFYGTDKYADIICKINGISNPFEINENDMLDIPRMEMLPFYSSENNSSNDLITNNSTIAKTRVSKQKELTKRRSPAEQVVGDKNYVIDKTIGMIFY